MSLDMQPFEKGCQDGILADKHWKLSISEYQGLVFKLFDQLWNI